ncbi:hypothetical protein PPO43_07250 [Saprospira sp. CCB-QB6]|uniref:hypothetical protein n=1 Tax=Saprospira sp. CCB-QB6 TaxID=3023936 RepID=UPI00234B259C|nr:hypothetical protein [Saprospira sp. CCB-QB6]WCL82884.1 hypothetical protein PPO43_07250 [Saprospira sp. CCB-QB6]
MWKFWKKRFRLSRLAKGKDLDLAQLRSAQQFVQARLNNPPRKALVGICLVVHEDPDFVYWGYPYFCRLFSDRRCMDELFKSPRAEVAALHPDYRLDFYSLRLRNRIRDCIRAQEELLDGQQFLGFTYRMPPKIETKTDCFEIEVRAYRQFRSSGEERSEKHSYYLKLSRPDLVLLDYR